MLRKIYLPQVIDWTLVFWFHVTMQSESWQTPFQAFFLLLNLISNRTFTCTCNRYYRILEYILSFLAYTLFSKSQLGCAVFQRPAHCSCDGKERADNFKIACLANHGWEVETIEGNVMDEQLGRLSKFRYLSFNLHQPCSKDLWLLEPTEQWLLPIS